MPHSANNSYKTEYTINPSEKPLISSNVQIEHPQCTVVQQAQHSSAYTAVFPSKKEIIIYVKKEICKFCKIKIDSEASFFLASLYFQSKEILMPPQSFTQYLKKPNQTFFSQIKV